MSRHRLLVLTLWPAFCGLIVGGLLGGLTQSWSLGVLLGIVGWLCFTGLTHSGGPTPPFDAGDGYDPQRIISPWDLPDAGDLEKEMLLHAWGVVGLGIYADMYRDPRSD